jgi:diguanylate cyclase (GGDEF)-like protein
MLEIINLHSKKFICVFAGGSTVAMATFTIFRFLKGDFPIAILDMVLTIFFFGFAACSYLSYKLDLVRRGLATSFIVGTIILTWISPETGSDWVYVIILAVYIILSSYKYALVMSTLLMVSAATVLLILNLKHDVDLITFVMRALSINAFAFLYASNYERSHRKLNSLSFTDALTGIGNRRAFIEKVTCVVSQYEGLSQHAFLFYLDVDNFKQINDRLGHAEGDRVLCRISSCLKTSVRMTDSLFRLGGDEFVILIGDASDDQAKLFAEKICQNVRQLTLCSGDLVSISIGCSQLIEDDTLDSWLNRSDEALYIAKRQGKNKAVLHGGISRQ